MNIDVFVDVMNLDQITEYISESWIKGVTTNPTLIKKGGALNYLDFAKNAAEMCDEVQISLEVIADDMEEMYRQALILSSLRKNIFVKIPITNTQSQYTDLLIEKLIAKGVRINVTAIMTEAQVDLILKSLISRGELILSVFAGRIADTGVDPIPLMKRIKEKISGRPEIKLLWASPREILNVIQADEIGCDIITATPEILQKMNLIGKNLTEFSLETVKMFRKDALDAGYNF
jgi:transaldolase